MIGEPTNRCSTPSHSSRFPLAALTRAIGSSFWPYFSRLHGGWSDRLRQRVETPTGYARFPRELSRPPRSLVERLYNVQRWTVMSAGGHFAALEEPEALAAELRAFFRTYR